MPNSSGIIADVLLILYSMQYYSYTLRRKRPPSLCVRILNEVSILLYVQCTVIIYSISASVNIF